MSMGKIIKKLRLANGMTQEELGQKLGVKKAAVQKYENGIIENIKRSTIERMAEIFDVSPSYIMGFTSDNPSEAIAPTGTAPILGRIPAGLPLLTEENILGYMPVMVKNPEEYFYLVVHGDSMINAEIPDESLVLIHKQPSAEDGDIVACRVNGNEATLKRFKKTADTVILIPENPKYSPIIVGGNDFDNGYAEIIGVAKQVIRNL